MNLNAQMTEEEKRELSENYDLAKFYRYGITEGIKIAMEKFKELSFENSVATVVDTAAIQDWYDCNLYLSD